jgi:hypothetical protein
LLDMSTEPPTIDPQTLWYSVHSAVDSFLSRLPVQQHRRVRGEPMLEQPMRWAAEMAEWLEIRTDDEALGCMIHPECSPFANLGPPRARFGGDPEFFRDPKLRSAKARRNTLNHALPWRPDGRSFTTAVCELARSFGYS